jgi:hypothetical protein
MHPFVQGTSPSVHTGNVNNLLSSHVITDQGTSRVGKPDKRHPPSGGRGRENHTPETLLPTPKHDTKGRWPSAARSEGASS